MNFPNLAQKRLGTRFPGSHFFATMHVWCSVTFSKIRPTQKFESWNIYSIFEHLSLQTRLWAFNLITLFVLHIEEGADDRRSLAAKGSKAQELKVHCCTPAVLTNEFRSLDILMISMEVSESDVFKIHSIVISISSIRRRHELVLICCIRPGSLKSSKL